MARQWENCQGRRKYDDNNLQFQKGTGDGERGLIAIIFYAAFTTRTLVRLACRVKRNAESPAEQSDWPGMKPCAKTCSCSRSLYSPDAPKWVVIGLPARQRNLGCRLYQNLQRSRRGSASNNNSKMHTTALRKRQSMGIFRANYQAAQVMDQ